MAAASFIAAIPMIGDAIGGSAKLGLKGTCFGSKIIFGGRAIGAAGGFALSLGQLYKASSDLANKHILNKQGWDDESNQMLRQGLFALGTGLLSAVSLGKNLDGFATSQCFVAGTLVLTIEGNKPIEEIKAGDLVYSTNPETGESEYKEVAQTFENETDELVHLTVKGDEITTTSKHPFYVPHKGWTSAIDLRTGDILVLSNGEYVIVEKVQHEILESPVKVYNFEVKDYHTYYVGENSVLVHNICTVDPAMQPKDIEEGVLTDDGYLKNPTAQNINDVISTDAKYLGVNSQKNLNGNYMYVLDEDRNIILGNRNGCHWPHPSLIGGENPTVLGAGMVDIRGGKIYSVNNNSGHFKPNANTLIDVEAAFEQLPQSLFHKNFQGYIPFS